ncbi:hypothetical protein I0Q12_26265, partial [Rhodococcus sp. CX]|nr:hypothetical protein [Rhodococcus sp. CX]
SAPPDPATTPSRSSGLVGPDGRTVARGVVAYDASELDFMIGFSTQNLPPDLQRPVVHADDLARL